MKKFLVMIAVLALTVVSSVAMAEVTVSGSIDIRNLSLSNTDSIAHGTGAEPAAANLFQSLQAAGAPITGQAPNLIDRDSNRTTQERIRLNVDAKNDGVKGRMTIENDWDVWGRVEQPQANGATAPTAANSGLGRFELREGWIDFTIPGAGPAHVKVGHQFLQLGNGWWFRSGKYGSDAWLVGLPGKNTVAFVNVKAAENATSRPDDTDAYVLLDNFKLSDTQTVGVYYAQVKDPQGKFFNGAFGNLFTAMTGSTGAGIGAPIDMLRADFANVKKATHTNIGLWFNGKVGPANLQFEYDKQQGKVESTNDTSAKFKGSQYVLQANMPIDPITVNATIAQGSGLKQGSNDLDLFVTVLDTDPHYTFVYEYLMKTACYGQKNTGFCNTNAVNVGVGYKITKNISIQADYWMLKAVKPVALNWNIDQTTGEMIESKDLGTELDVVVKVNLYDQLSWNWQFGRMSPGAAYKNNLGKVSNVDAIQGVLSYKF